MELIVNLMIFVIPLDVFGLIIARRVQKKHIQRLDAFDQETAGFLVTQLKSFPQATIGERPPSLVVAEVVIGSDYLKSFLAQWRNLFGGEVRSFQTLTTRAKREAINRLKRAAMDQGFNALCNVRISSADIGGGTNSKNKTPMASVIASGTAYYTSRSA